MDIRPILSTLRRHKTAAALIVIEIALSCAIICNAVFLISERVNRIDMTSGVADDAIVDIHIAGIDIVREQLRIASGECVAACSTSAPTCVSM